MRDVEEHLRLGARYVIFGDLGFICLTITKPLQKPWREELRDCVNRMRVAVAVTVLFLSVLCALDTIPVIVALFPEIPKNNSSIASRRA